MMELEEYIKLYEKKTGERFCPNAQFSFFYEPEHGFCEYNIKDNNLYIWQLCGDVAYWVGTAYQTAKILGLQSMGAYIVRHPKPFIRLLGFKIKKTECVDGYYRYTCENKAGEKLMATQYGDKHTFVWYMKDGETNV